MPPHPYRIRAMLAGKPSPVEVHEGEDVAVATVGIIVGLLGVVVGVVWERPIELSIGLLVTAFLGRAIWNDRVRARHSTFRR